MLRRDSVPMRMLFFTVWNFFFLRSLDIQSCGFTLGAVFIADNQLLSHS